MIRNADNSMLDMNGSTPVVDVMGLPIWALDVDGLIRLLVDRAALGVSCSVSYVNAHTFDMTRRDGAFRQALLASDVLYADGMSVVWASRLLSEPLPERLSSADYVNDFALACAEREVSVYMLGGEPGVADRAADRLRQIAPGLSIVGAEHGYFDTTAGMSVIRRVNDSGADLLMLGMGSPRQELWSARHRADLSVPVIWSVGALFDYLADVESRAPQWMCRHGLEWAYRLAVDPMGKARRYLLGNPRFLSAVARAWLTRALPGRTTIQEVMKG